MSPWEAIAAVASRQHGLVTRGQLYDVGLRRHHVEHLVSTRRLRRVRPQVFVTAGAVPTWEQAVLGAVLAAGSGAVASHDTAAALWGLPGARRAGLEVTTDRPRHARLEGVQSHRTVAFLAAEHSSRGAIPVTSVARTLVDLSARWSVKQLGSAADHAQRRGLLRLDQLRVCVAGLPPAPGRRPSRVHAVLGRRLPGYEPGDSDLEVRFARGLVAGGLPEPVLQHWVRLGSRRYRVDLAYPESMIAIEIDGWDTHRSRSAFDADRARANDLVVAGWRVLRFTSAMTAGEAVAIVTQALGALTQGDSA
jgi:Protein of unknown function (DUF559)